MNNPKSSLKPLLAIVATLALTLLLPGQEVGTVMPRNPLPPWPETSLGKWTFDEPFWFTAAQANAGQAVAVDNSLWVPSWSGYALNRQGVSVQTPLTLPMVTTNRWNVAPDEGAVRLWYSPAFSSASSGLGTGPGHLARLLELSMQGDNGGVVLWSLYISENGNTLYLSGEGEDGPFDFLKANIQWQAGEWHLISISYGSWTALTAPMPWPTSAAAPDGSPRATFLHLDGQLVAIGQGLPIVPTTLATATKLAVGSCADGSSPAAGQLEELTTFAFPLSAWQWGNYYDSFRGVAAMGPVTPAEIAARRAAAQALQVSLAANPSLLSTSGTMDMMGGGSPMFFNYTNGFWLACPTNTGTNILLRLANAETNKSYDIYFVWVLTSNLTFFSTIATNGSQGQTNFAMQNIGDTRFFRAAESGDWDRDGVPNWADPQPFNSAVSNLLITIESPANHSTVP